MKTIKINDKEYVLEFSFAAVEHKNLVQKMFEIMSGGFITKRTAFIADGNEEDAKLVVASAMLDGVGDLVSEIPHVCITAFYAGLLENNPLTETDAKEVMKAYMKANKLSFKALFDELKACMEDDGFFDLSGLNEMMQSMTENQTKIKEVKKPQDHKKKSTSTK